MSCEMHGNPGSFYCRECGEMAPCDRALDALDTPDEFPCACACRRITQNIRILVFKTDADKRDAPILDVTHKVVYTRDSYPTPFEVFSQERTGMIKIRVEVTNAD